MGLVMPCYRQGGGVEFQISMTPTRLKLLRRNKAFAFAFGELVITCACLAHSEIECALFAICFNDNDAGCCQQNLIVRHVLSSVMPRRTGLGG
ncbi:hypothetical protein DB385_04195 [Pseudomonas aeruginosa]|nr:hypothetical protein DB385_04195 [Pseudomonas aeruginosa]